MRDFLRIAALTFGTVLLLGGCESCSEPLNRIDDLDPIGDPNRDDAGTPPVDGGTNVDAGFPDGDAGPEPEADGGTPPVRDIVTASVGGEAHQCHLLSHGGVRCFGSNDQGQLGYPGRWWVGWEQNETIETTPDVDLPGPVASIDADGRRTCALMAGSAEVYCWGDNDAGAAGYANRINYGVNRTPATAGPVSVGGRAVQVAVGESHTCALLESGELRCWGDGRYGQNGQGSTNDVGDDELPSSVPPLSFEQSVLQVAAGGDRTCVLLADRTVRCFGEDAWLHQPVATRPAGDSNIGDTEAVAVSPPVDLGGPVEHIDVSRTMLCGLRADRQVRCYGWQAAPQNPGHPSAVTHEDIDFGAPVIAVKAGHGFACGLLEHRAIRCFGQNDNGNLGYGAEDIVGDEEGETPAAMGDVDVGDDIAMLGTGPFVTCAGLADGSLRCFGHGENGSLASGYRFNIGDALGETPRRTWEIIESVRAGGEPSVPSPSCAHDPSPFPPPPGADQEEWFGATAQPFRFATKPLIAEESLQIGQGPRGALLRLGLETATGIQNLGLAKVDDSGWWRLQLPITLSAGDVVGLEVVELFAVAEESGCGRVFNVVDGLAPYQGTGARPSLDNRFFWDTTDVLPPISSCPPAVPAEVPEVDGSIDAYEALFAPGVRRFSLDPIEPGGHTVSGSGPRGAHIIINNFSLTYLPPFAEAYIGDDGRFSVSVCPSYMYERAPIAIRLVDIPSKPAEWSYWDLEADLLARGMAGPSAISLPLLDMAWTRRWVGSNDGQEDTP